MSRLPIIGGDYDAWGTVLNDYLNETAAVATLSASTSAGDTTATLAVVPPGLVVGSIVAIDAYTTQCELRSVSGISGNTLTVAALKFSHSSGDTLTVLHGHATIDLFGLTGDGTNEWAPLQRLVLEGVGLSLVIDGLQRKIKIAQPLVFPTSSYTSRMWLETHSTFAPIDADGGAITIAMRNSAFTATASDNTFTTPAAHGMSINQQIIFAAPYGETLPGSIVAGRLYWVKTVPTGSTFTISATQGGAEFDVTSDGEGWDFSSTGLTTLVRLHWESFWLWLSVADVNGLLTDLQQPSWSRNMRIEMQAAASSQAYGWQLTGQQSYHENVEVNTSGNCTGIKIEGTGHIVRGINDNGTGTMTDTVVEIAGDAISISDLWTENVGTGVRFSNTSRGCSIGGTWHHVSNTEPATNPAVLVETAQTSYRVNMIRSQVDTPLFLNDTARSLTITYADIDHMNPGWVQGYGAGAPVLESLSSPQTYSASNVVTDRSYDANATDVNELADVLGTLIADLRNRKIVD